MMNFPELLSPAGNRERLDMALHYGADAVYLAGSHFGMRSAAGNFTPEGMAEAVQLCRRAGARVYVTVNTLPHQGQIGPLPGYLEQLEELGVDALIVADLGVMALAKQYAPHVPLHISTQFGVVNAAAAGMLHDLGASRVVLARELSLEDIAALRAKAPRELELEAFVHGAMCVSFSGRCLLSNYMTGRDANGGACAQPCRWTYHLVEEKRPGQYFPIIEDGGTHILNSHDMCMIEHLPLLHEAGIDSFKIEGRMKSAYYAAISTYAYRGALDDLRAGRPLDPLWREECEKLSHRPYSTGFYFGQPGQCYGEGMYSASADVCAVVEGVTADGRVRLTQRNKFSVGDRVELVSAGERPVCFTVTELWDEDGAPLSSVPRAMMPFVMALPGKAERLSLLRKLK